MESKRLFFILAALLSLLLIPFIAMQFTDEVSWTGFDFLVMGILLSGAGLLCELILSKVTRIKYRIILCLAVLGLFLIIWAELAVGIFGTLFSGN